jgi:hypothetical protein
MKSIYVLVYSYDNKSISNFVFFASREEAIEWKKKQIADGECGNTLDKYTVVRLESL